MVRIFCHFVHILQHFLLFQHLNNWPKHLPICCHAEGQTTAAILLMAELCDRPVHICHVARQSEVSFSLVLCGGTVVYVL